LIIYGSLTTLTGGYLYDRRVVDYLRSQGDHVQVFSLPWRDYARHLLDNIGWSLPSALRSARLDILVQDELNHPSLFWLNQRLRWRVHYPMVSLVHHMRCSELRPAWQNQLYRLVERSYLSTVDGFIFNSVTTRSTVEALVGAHKPSVVAYPGQDANFQTPSPDRIRRRSFEPGPLRLVFVGSLIHRKNLHTLVKALCSLPRDQWRLDVVGSPDIDPAYAKRLTAQIDKEHAWGQITLRGTLSREELEAVYLQSHLLAVPSSYEGFGIVYMEGMGFGLPAIASNTGAAPEIVTHGRDGLLVNPRGVEEIASHIADVASDRERLFSMSMAAIQRHGTHPTWLETASSIRKFLQEMIT